MQNWKTLCLQAAAPLLGVVCLWQQSGQSASQSAPAAEREVQRARADISGTGIKGEAEFVEMEQGAGRYVRVIVRLQGDPATLKPGLHGVHLHEKGVCEAPFTSAGGHFDPGPAGNSDPDVNHPYHLGDLPNIEIDQRGNGELNAVTTRITLSAGPLSVPDADGTAIIIHADRDQRISGARGSGVSGGGRLACGVLRQPERSAR